MEYIKKVKERVCEGVCIKIKKGFGRGERKVNTKRGKAEARYSI